MRLIKKLGLVGGLTVAVAAQAQAPAVQKANKAADASEESSGQRASTAAAQGDDGFGGDDTTAAADKAAAEEGGGGGGGGGGEGGGGEAVAPEEYTVVPGDTLWDLCERFLQNPFYWPKIWSINPHIENAHWIYPGNIIRFYAGGEGTKEGGEPVAATEGGGEQQPGEGGEAKPAGEGGEGGEGGDFAAGEQVGEGGEGGEGGGEDFEAGAAVDEVARPEQLFDSGGLAKLYENVLNNTGSNRRLTTFVSKKELEKSGEITAGLSDVMWLSSNQDVVVSTKNAPHVGDRFHIFRATRSIRHPNKPGELGAMVEILGVAEITLVEGGKAKAFIREAYGPIERGDRLTPFVEWAPAPAPKANTKNLKGVVADTYEEYASALGEYHVVFLDKGKGDGVEPGNTFEVLRNDDAYTGESRKAPDEIVGRILVLDAKDGASTGLITMSRTEIMVGDRVEMRASSK